MDASFHGVEQMNWFSSIVHSWRIRNAEIDPRSKCPACGSRALPPLIKCVEVEKADVGRTWMIQRTCLICFAQCYEPTIVDPKIWAIADLKPLPPRPS